MTSWPSSVPFVFLVDGFSHQAMSNTTAIDVESGEPLSRRRFTGEMDTISGTMRNLTIEQVRVLRSFYRYDLKDGALRFTENDPVTGEAREFIFAEAPVFSPIDGYWWRPSIRLIALT